MHVRVALDSMPLSDSSADCRDHSGSQVFALTHAPLVAFSLHAETAPPRLVAAREVATCKEGRRHRVVLRPDLRWSDGEPARPAHFIEPILRLSDESPHLAESFWLRDLTAITPHNDGFEVCTARPRFRFLALTSLLCLGARRPEPTSARLGRYHHAVSATGSIRLEANRHWTGPAQEPTGDPRSVEFVHIKDPGQNIARFADGDLDVTADTAFPYQLVPERLENEQLRVSQPGIFISLAFEGELAAPSQRAVRARVRDALDANALCEAFGGVMIAKRDYLPTIGRLREHLRQASGILSPPPLAPSHRAGGATLRLAFDDYYPNRELCAVICQQLRTAGIEVMLVEDSFAAPAQRADMRLVLNKGIHPGQLGMYHGLLFSEALRAEPTVFSQYLGLLEEAETTPVPTLAQVEHVAGKLQAILNREAVIVPLAELPGLALSRLRRFPFDAEPA